MIHSLISRNFLSESILKLFSGNRHFSQVILLSLLTWLVLLVPAHATELPIDIVNTWVEDGFLFHVEFEAQPANANCELEGEGLIEFEVAYDAPTNSRVESVFGVATWYPNSDIENWIETQGQAIGPQALCTEFSPCHIQTVNIVQTWCPVTNGPLFP